MPNTHWRIAYGDYDFAIDRQTLAYSLTETKTETVWAEGLSAGWIELEDRESGFRARYNFSDAKLISVAEKSSHQGKRILFGLDLLGIPIDLYFICSEKEIQLTVEANRDTKSHKVQDIGLLPGLVSVPDDGASYLVLPHGDGVLIHAKDAPNAARSFPIWKSHGVVMPFAGAVRMPVGNSEVPLSAISIVTDSAYSAFRLSRLTDDCATLDTEYCRDPQRRRLDLRVTMLVHGDHIAVARFYREKVISDRNHVTLRKKMREVLSLECSIGAAYFIGSRSDIGNRATEIAGRANILQSELEVARVTSIGKDDSIASAISWLDWPRSEAQNDIWEEMESLIADASAAHSGDKLVCVTFEGDWCAFAVDIAMAEPYFGDKWASIPLLAVVYHDSIIIPELVSSNIGFHFLRALRHLAPPRYHETTAQLGTDRRLGAERRETIRRTFNVLGPLHQLTFPAFLTEHRFLTQDFQVEEAVYTDKTCVLINKSETEPFERDDIALPPQGFYVHHAQMEAHYALRVGDVTFDKPAWRIRRSQDGRSLEESEDIIVQEFPV